MAQRGKKAADIARATGVQPGVLSRYISGKVVPSSENLITISQFLGVSPNWLLNASDGLELPQTVYNPTDKDKIIEVQGKLIDAQSSAHQDEHKGKDLQAVHSFPGLRRSQRSTNNPPSP